VGFNIKMLQAFLPLPALAAAYVLGSRARGWKKLLHLALAGLILLTVSLAWVAAVDLTPPDRRPYIGSSEDNTVLSLIVGHNGLNRLFGRSWLADAASGPSTGDGPPPSDGAPPSDGGASSADAVRPEGPGPEGNRQNSGGRGPDEIGVPGAFRLFIPPLSNEAAWVLPLALVGAAWLAWLLRGAPGRKGRISLWVWGGWLVTGWVFFSMAGFFHAYYLSLLAGPSAVLGGAALGWMIELVGKDRRRWAVLAGWVVCLFVFQVWVAIPYGLPVFPLAAAAVLAVPAIVLAAGARPRAGAVLLVLVLMILPGFWTLQTALDPGRNVNLPAAWEGPGQEDAPRPPGGERTGWDSRLVPFLTERYAGSGYLVAAPSAMAGADLVLETGLPVLYIGGFNGSDPVAGADDLAGMAAEGSLRFVLWSFASGPGASREVGAWLREACVPVPGFGDGALVLLDCGGNE
jgi:4-amino-4-deoxy-L-arabinose transferase-like glycosyltransferase